ncbi:MAG: type I-E CRISPR-associated protein Cse1/CasA [Clostridia bacterium]
MKPQPGRALWRDVGVLAFAREEARTNLSPLIVASRSKIIPADESLVALKTYALGTDLAQYTNWKRDELMLPSCLLEDALRGEVLRQDMNFCEQVANLLQKEVKKSSAQIADEAQMAFFEDVHLFVFGRYMEKLIQMDVEQDHAASVVSFDKRIEEILRDCLEKSLTRLGDDGKKLIRQVVIRNVIYGKYRKMRKERENGDE